MPVLHALPDLAQIRSLAWLDHPLVHAALHRRRGAPLPLCLFPGPLDLHGLAADLPPDVPRWLPHNPRLPVLEPGSDTGEGRPRDSRGADTELPDARHRGGRGGKVARAQ